MYVMYYNLYTKSLNYYVCLAFEMTISSGFAFLESDMFFDKAAQT